MKDTQRQKNWAQGQTVSLRNRTCDDHASILQGHHPQDCGYALVPEQVTTSVPVDIASEVVDSTPDGWELTAAAGLPVQHRPIYPVCAVPAILMIGQQLVGKRVTTEALVLERCSPAGHANDGHACGTCRGDQGGL